MENIEDYKLQISTLEESIQREFEKLEESQHVLDKLQRYKNLQSLIREELGEALKGFNSSIFEAPKQDEARLKSE